VTGTVLWVVLATVAVAGAFAMLLDSAEPASGSALQHGGGGARWVTRVGMTPAITTDNGWGLRVPRAAAAAATPPATLTFFITVSMLLCVAVISRPPLLQTQLLSRSCIF
jgi:hypothetical protein